MKKRSAGFVVIEAFLVTLVTGALGLLSAATLGATTKTYPAEMLAEEIEYWQRSVGQCELLQLTPNCHRYLSGKAYGGAATQQTRLNLSVIPDPDLSHFSNSTFRLFGSKDTRGAKYELRAAVGNNYDFTYTGGGGVITLDADDFMPGRAQQVQIDLQQQKFELQVKIWVDGQLKFERLVPGRLNHGNQYMAFGEWDNGQQLETFYGQVAVLGVWLE